jgi:integrase
VRLLILTGQRENEVAGMKWDEIDFDHKIRFKDGNKKERIIHCLMWTVPAERMKGKDSRTHEVPLGPEAVALLKALPATGANYIDRTGGGGIVSGATFKFDILGAPENAVNHSINGVVASTQVCNIIGTHGVAEAITAFRILMSAGTVTGNFYLYSVQR